MNQNEVNDNNQVVHVQLRDQTQNIGDPIWSQNSSNSAGQIQTEQQNSESNHFLLEMMRKMLMESEKRIDLRIQSLRSAPNPLYNNSPQMNLPVAPIPPPMNFTAPPQMNFNSQPQMSFTNPPQQRHYNITTLPLPVVPQPTSNNYVTPPS